MMATIVVFLLYQSRFGQGGVSSFYLFLSFKTREGQDEVICAALCGREGPYIWLSCPLDDPPAATSRTPGRRSPNKF